MAEFCRVASLRTGLVVTALVGGILVAFSTVAIAQIDDDKVFNLSTAESLHAAEDSTTVIERYEPRIEPGRFEFSLTLGYYGLSKTLLEHDQMIYKANTQFFYYGDVSLEGESAFTPFLHAAYNVTPYLAVEGCLGLAFSEYNATISHARAVSPEGGEPEIVEPGEIGEFDAERRSVLGIFTNVNAVLYPLNIGNEGKGRWHPYVTAGLGRAQYDMDSNYTDKGAAALNLAFGGGLRLIADDMISVRFEVLQMVHDIEFTPAKNFEVRDEGTVVIPVYQFARNGFPSEVEEYSSNSLGSLAWSLGVTASF